MSGYVFQWLELTFSAPSSLAESVRNTYACHIFSILFKDIIVLEAWIRVGCGAIFESLKSLLIMIRQEQHA